MTQRVTGIAPGERLTIICEASELQAEVERLQAELDALKVAILDYWNASAAYTTPAGEAAEAKIAALLGATGEI